MASFDNKNIVIITNDNKGMKCHSYYHFSMLFDNKELLMITNDKDEYQGPSVLEEERTEYFT